MTKEQEFEFMEKEHEAGFHKTYQAGCSTCFRENRIIQVKKTVMGRPLTDHFRNPYGDNYPLGYIPE